MEEYIFVFLNLSHLTFLLYSTTVHLKFPSSQSSGAEQNKSMINDASLG